MPNLEFASLDTDQGLKITIFTGEQDGARVIQIDTTFEPNDEPFRIWLNDHPLHASEAPK